MLKNLAIFSLSFGFALLILFISIFRLAQIPYNVYGKSPVPTPNTNFKKEKIGYNLPYTSNIKEDSPLWPLEALRDKAWIALTFNPAKKADLYLHFADDRLSNAKYFFENNNPSLGLSVLEKGEKYLELAQRQERVANSQGMDTTTFLKRYTLATLMHRGVLDEIVAIAPEDARPMIVKTQNYSKTLFNLARDGMMQASLTPPQNPFIN